MKKILNFKWEIVVTLFYSILCIMMLSLGIKDIYMLLGDILAISMIPLIFIGIKTMRKMMKEILL